MRDLAEVAQLSSLTFKLTKVGMLSFISTSLVMLLGWQVRDKKAINKSGKTI